MCIRERSSTVATTLERNLNLSHIVRRISVPSDPRAKLSLTIGSIHILGQLGLDFRVSVPQIFAAILAGVLVEEVWSYRRNRRLVWPASAILTGSGVAL